MIRNLNQLNFQGYGAVHPERSLAEPKPAREGIRQTFHLSRSPQSPVYLTASDTWAVRMGGMAVLSVSTDGRDFCHFYLDKSVCIRPGIYFALSPFQQGATAAITAQVPPEPTGHFLPVTDFHLVSNIQVNSLYTFFYQEREKGFLFPGESHPMPELTYVDQGSLHSIADGQDLLLEQGDMAIYGPGQWHMQYADMDVTASFITITFDVSNADLSPLLNRKIKVTQAAVNLLQQMLREQDHTDPYSGDMTMCLLTGLLLTLLRDADKPETRLRTGSAIHSENEIIRRAQQYISSHIRERLSVPIVASHADVSPSYLTALFHKNLQISPGEYIRRAKLQESKQLIREGNMNFTEIAAALQYSTVHHFSRQFKEKFGITPTEYAKSVR